MFTDYFCYKSVTVCRFCHIIYCDDFSLLAFAMTAKVSVILTAALWRQRLIKDSVFTEIKITVTETETEKLVTILTFIALNVLLKVSIICISTQLKKKSFIHFKITATLHYVTVICETISF